MMKSLIAGVVLAVTCLPALNAAASASAMESSGAVIAQPGGGTIEHWGVFAGGDRELSPVPVYLPGQIAQVGTSNSTQYALLTNGQLWAWGVGTHGELGNGGTQNSFTNPVQVQFPPGVRIASIPTDAMPFDTAYAIDTNGNVWGWGINQGGELCLGNEQQYNTPVELGFFSDVTSVAGAANHTTYDADGTLYSCGQNNVGQLGDGNKEASRVPVKVTGLSGQSVTALVSGFNNVGALLANGTYYDWGWNADGQLGDGNVGQNSEVPVQVNLPAPATQVVQGGNAPGDGQSFALLSNGALYAWGADASFQLGNGRQVKAPSPEQIFPPSGVTYQTLASGGETSYAISTTGNVYAWGGNRYGQVGDGTTATATEPVLVASGATLISSTSSDVAISVQQG
jgi:alpha-tubulin suppressor-like RCC1 family protein